MCVFFFFWRRGGGGGKGFPHKAVADSLVPGQLVATFGFGFGRHLGFIRAAHRNIQQALDGNGYIYIYIYIYMYMYMYMYMYLYIYIYIYI